MKQQHQVLPQKTASASSSRQKILLGRATAVTVVMLGIAANTAFAADDLSSAVTSLQTETISNIGLVVAAAFAVLVASLVPDIGLGLAKKWIKKGAS